jgi:hypothetical protein
MTQTDAAELRRELLALFGRIEDGPLTLEAGLRASAVVRRALDALQEELVGLARQEGAPWASIGAALGVTTQAAHQRFGPPPTKKRAPTA